MPDNICKLFGKGLKNLNPNELPSILDVMRHFFFIQKNNSKSGYETIARKIVTENLKIIWSSHGIPIVSEVMIQKNLKKYWDNRRQLLKNIHSKRFNDQRNSLRSKFNVLFDIFSNKKGSQISKTALQFLKGQRSPRPMFKKAELQHNIVSNPSIKLEFEDFEEVEKDEEDEEMEIVDKLGLENEDECTLENEGNYRDLENEDNELIGWENEEDESEFMSCEEMNDCEESEEEDTEFENCFDDEFKEKGTKKMD